MSTEWTHRLDFFVVAADNTLANRTAFAEFLSLNGSLETTANELKMFDSVVRFSVSGNLPAQGFGLSVPVKPAMRDDFIAFASTLTQYRYFVVRAIDNVLVLTNSAQTTPPVDNWTRVNSFQAINAERVSLGAQPWRVIEEVSEI